jgi:GT2 family glycosyltransferase
LTLPGLRLGALRNRAVAAARGPVLAFVDADHEIASDWIQTALDALAEPNVVAAGAPCRPPRDSTWVQRHYDRLRPHRPGRQTVDWLGSGNMAVHRSAFESVGGFDVSLETCEDVDLCRKLRMTGGRLLSDDRMLNIHYGDPATLRHVFTGELWRGRDNIRVSLRGPRRWRTLASAAIPIAVFLALVLSVLGVIWRGAAGPWTAGFALAFVLLLVAARSSLMLSRAGLWPREWPSAFAVAGAYELGRAMALATRAGHGWRRRTTS